MQFPVWDLSSLGGGFWIAAIATFHVYIAHLAVGGGLFIVLTQMWAYKSNSQPMLEYVKKHTRFFLLLTMVAGGITGVGIWLTISVLTPAVTSELIRNFVFGWATEWVFFIGEILALLIYYHMFGKMKKRDHVIIGWLYFIFAWLSLFIINGIIGFMLTPGAWITTGNFFDGFFNPSFWPSLVFRTFASGMIAGLFALLTALRIKDDATREKLVRYSMIWSIVGVILVFVTSFWYLDVIPPEVMNLLNGRSPEISFWKEIFVFMAPAIIILGILALIKMPKSVRIPLAVVLLLVGFAFFGSFEFIREAARKPYLIYNHYYSNSIPVAEAAALQEQGYLKTAKWVPDELRQITNENKVAAGKLLFNHQCLSCHSIDGVMNDIMPRTKKFGMLGMTSMLNGLGKINKYMPPFLGTAEERDALAIYIVKDLHGKTEEEMVAADLEQLPFEMPEKVSEDYVLLAWNNLGMHCVTNTGKYWIILPPANDLQAMVIKRGDPPTVLMGDEIEISYSVEEGFENPVDHVDFWTYSESLVGKRLDANVGVTGNGLTGTMKFKEDPGWFEADKIPVLPYNDDSSFNPYPLFTLTATEKSTGEVVAITKVVAPNSTETGCANCHGGSMYREDKIGISAITAEDILVVHDRMNNTDLMQRARSGKPFMCQSCHPDPALGTPGEPGVLTMSAAIHGFHANYLTGMGVDACNSCHPSNPDGYTRCFRGVHADVGLTCVECHGHLEDHAISLLKAEINEGKESAKMLIENIKPVSVATIEEIIPRMSWLQEPDCLACHEYYETPMEFNSFNKWVDDFASLFRNSKGEMDAVFCSACHGSPHALYDAYNPYGENRDVIQPLQYSGLRRPIGAQGNCMICHTVEPDPDIPHHPNMIQMK